MQGDSLGKPDPFAQRVAGLDIFRRQIDACHLAAIAVRDEAGRATEPASDIQDLRLIIEGQLIEEIRGRLATADVKLVDRRKVVDPDRVRTLAECRKPG